MLLIAALSVLNGCAVYQAMGNYPHHEKVSSHFVNQEGYSRVQTFEDAKSDFENGVFIPIEYDPWDFDSAIFGSEQKIMRMGGFNEVTYSYGQGSTWPMLSLNLAPSVEYWMIRHVKAATVSNLADLSRSEFHDFAPFALYGKEGLGSLFEIKDMDEESYRTLVAIAEAADLTDHETKVLVHMCMPEFGKRVIGLEEFDHRIEKEHQCDSYMRRMNIDFAGMPIPHPEPNAIVQHEVLYGGEQQNLQTGFYRHLFYADTLPTPNRIGRNNVNAFDSLADPDIPRVMVGLSSSLAHMPDGEARFKDSLPNRTTNPGQFAGYFVEEVLKLGFVEKFRNYDMMMKAMARSPYDTFIEPQLFSRCSSAGNDVIAYQNVVFARFSCWQHAKGDYAGAYGKAYGGSTADFNLVTHREDQLIKATGGTPNQGAMMFLNMQYTAESVLSGEQKETGIEAFDKIMQKQTKRELIEDLITRAPFYAYVAWTERDGEKTMGYVYHWGILWSFDLTKEADWLRSEHT